MVYDNCGGDRMSYLIGELAEIAGVSVRTLHHYDSIGLLKPTSVSPAEYRYYTESDVEKLQQILFFKEMDFSLKDTAQIINKPDFDRIKALKAHRQLLCEKRKRLEALIASVEKTIESVEGDAKMNNEEMFKAFNMSDIEKHKDKYAQEVKLKYGESEAYKESERRASKYSKVDWENIMNRSNLLFEKIASLMDKGPEDKEVQKAVSEWRQHITDSFYNCTPEIFRGLGELYVCDERFTQNIDKVKPGLARFLSEAIKIYCDTL
jgi:DNA-binding transcriptional MerR regulator